MRLLIEVVLCIELCIVHTAYAVDILYYKEFCSVEGNMTEVCSEEIAKIFRPENACFLISPIASSAGC